MLLPVLPLLLPGLAAPAGAAQPRHFELRGPDQISLSLAPEAGVNLLGVPHTVTATLTDSGRPVPDAAILFRVSGINITSDLRFTNSSGQAVFTYSGIIPGTDLISACHDANNSSVCDEGESVAAATKLWVGEHAYLLALSPLEASNPVDTPHTMTATLTDHGIPVGGAAIHFQAVHFEGDQGTGTTLSGDATTDPGGVAVFSYTASTAGHDDITACHDTDASRSCEAGELSDSATKEWILVHEFALAIAPESATNPVGTPHTVTATLTDDGTPVASAPILFTVSGANSGAGSQTTDASGQASFTYTGTANGQDTIAACYDANGSGGCDAGEPSVVATKVWTPPPGNDPPDCSGVRVSPNLLWPPNHKLRLVTLAGASDPDGDPVELSITGVTQDEPTSDGGGGDRAPDAQTAAAGHQVWLRAERSGNGDGRVYRIAVTATDGRGGACSGVVLVGVPHDKGRGADAVDSGSVFGSTGS